MSITDEEWELVLANIRLAPMTKDEKRALLTELAARYGRELTPSDFIKAGVATV
ncbi:MAG: hypothetical protein NZ992_00690 [Candidatus Korarchaeum sp.]|nr:hypothetical protein [Candidatus Korarchaeum sp.]MDW8035513.1 hypothetical protein [Candidatus Korarchaeum sp.]